MAGTRGIDLKQGHRTLSHGMYNLEFPKQALFVNGTYNETTAAKIRCRKIELVQAKNAVE